MNFNVIHWNFILREKKIKRVRGKKSRINIIPRRQIPVEQAEYVIKKKCMAISDSGNPSDMEEMPPSDRNSDTSRLIAPNPTSKTSYINLVGNVCALLFVCIIIYCCFANGVTLFSFHPSLMTLGVSFYEYIF